MRGPISPLLGFPQVRFCPRVAAARPRRQRSRSQPAPRPQPLPGAPRALAEAVPTSVISVCPGQISACGQRDPLCYGALILPGHGLQPKAYYSVNDLVFSSEDLARGLHAN